MKCARALRVLLVHPRDIQAASASISSLHFKGLHRSAKLATGYTTRVAERKAQIAAVAQPAPTHALHPRARAPGSRPIRCQPVRVVDRMLEGVLTRRREHWEHRHRRGLLTGGADPH